MTGYQVLWSTSLPKYSPPGTLSYLRPEYSPVEHCKNSTPSFVLGRLQRVKVGWTIGCWNSWHSGVKWAAAAFCNPCLSFEASIEYRWKIGFLSLSNKKDQLTSIEKISINFLLLLLSFQTTRKQFSLNFSHFPREKLILNNLSMTQLHLWRVLIVFNWHKLVNYKCNIEAQWGLTLKIYKTFLR